jgi:hypothetical protein
MADFVETLRIPINDRVADVKTKAATGSVTQEIIDQTTRAVFTILEEPTRIRELALHAPLPKYTEQAIRTA